MKVTDVGFEAVTQPYLDSDNVVIVPLSLPLRYVIGKERFRYLLEVAERI